MIRQRELMVRHRRRIALLAVLGTLLVAVLAHHHAPDHGGPGEGEMGALVSICLAVLDAVAVAAVAAVARFSSLPWTGGPSLEPRMPAGTAAMRPAIRIAQPRAGPSALQVFRR